MTDDEKRAARIRRAADYDFKQECRAMLPIATDQLLEDLETGKIKAKGELIRTVELLRDSVHGRPTQALTGPDGGPLVGTFTLMLAHVDGAKVERLIDQAVAAGTNGNGKHETLCSGIVATEAPERTERVPILRPSGKI